MKRIKKERVKWLLADVQPWFQYSVHHNLTKQPSSVAAIYLSRVSIQEHLASGPMTTVKRLSLMASDAPKTKLFMSGDVTHRPSEKEIVARLARMAAGLDPS
ncbi:hypothetical protein ACJ2CR_19220 [Myxococcus faecalis]|uniref:hypothetical protein n=1 Tax=Myxococcus faecalis TaxID=3115646 RepID=UPI0038D00014